MTGSTISHYEIAEKLGTGGMGVVYKAFDLRLKRNVAIKFLPHHLTFDSEAKQRFISEARTASAIDHPNICSIYDINETKDGQTYIVMAYYNGETLRKKIDDKQLTREDIFNISYQTLSALSAAHQKGIIHRDIKPANIMIRDDGIVTLLDFGLAKLAGKSGLTEVNSTLGTVSYMSPEQTKGRSVDFKTDIWSFGVVLYEMLNYSLPFGGDYNQAVIYSILNEAPEKNNPEFGELKMLEPVINKCLEKESTKRYGTSDEIIKDFYETTQKLKLDYNRIRIPPATVQVRKEKRKKNVIYWTALSLIIAMIATYFINSNKIHSLFKGKTQKEYTRIAILPFDINADNQLDSMFCLGLIESAVDKLSGSERYFKDVRIYSYTVKRYEFYFKSDFHNDDSVKAWAIDAEKHWEPDIVIRGRISKKSNNIVIEIYTGNINNGLIRYEPTKVLNDKIANIRTWQDSLICTMVRQFGIEPDSALRTDLVERNTSLSFAAFKSHRIGYGFFGRSGSGSRYLDSAEKYIEIAVTEDPSFSLAFSDLSSVYKRKYDSTFENEYLAKAKSFSESAINQNKLLIKPYNIIAYYYEKNDLINHANSFYEKALKIDSTDVETYLNFAGFHTSIGTSNILAEDNYMKAIQLRPNDYSLYAYFAVYYDYLKKCNKAIEYINNSIELSPNFKTYYLKGSFYQHLGLSDSAKKYLLKSINLKEYDLTLSNLATVYYKSQNYEDASYYYAKAIEFYEKNDRVDKANYFLYGNLASCLEELDEKSGLIRENFNKAINLCVEFLKSGPPDSISHLAELAGYYSSIGERRKALKILSEIEDPMPVNADVMYSIAQTYETLDSLDKADEWLLEAKETDPKISEKILNSPKFNNLKADKNRRRKLNI